MKITYFAAPLVNIIFGLSNANVANSNENIAHLATFETFDAEKDMIFYLFTNANAKREEVIILHNLTSLEQSSFQPDENVRILIAGYNSDKNSQGPLNVRDAYLAQSNANVFIVDWSKGSKTLFYQDAALHRVPQAGRVLTQFVDFLVKGGASYDKTHLIGHSLGAHIVGIAGKRTGEKVNTIFGLDPAGPLFTKFIESNRLARGDAIYVEVIHTSAFGFEGFAKPLGDSDFYVNGGRMQPGCKELVFDGCSHSRAWYLMAESIRKNKFWAVRCSFKLVALGLCLDRNYVVKMGGDPSHTNSRGVFYLRTNSKSPYGMGKA